MIPGAQRLPVRAIFAALLLVILRANVVVGEFDRGSAVDRGYLADQANRVKAGTAGGVAAAEIVGQQGSPTCAETNAAARGPLFRIKEIVGTAKVVDRNSAGQFSAEISVQSEDVMDIERIGGDDELLLRISTARLKPRNVFVACDVGIFAVDTLPGPIGHPVGGVL